MIKCKVIYLKSGERFTLMAVPSRTITFFGKLETTQRRRELQSLRTSEPSIRLLASSCVSLQMSHYTRKDVNTSSDFMLNSPKNPILHFSPSRKISFDATTCNLHTHRIDSFSKSCPSNRTKSVLHLRLLC